MAYADLKQLKRYLGISETNDDTLLGYMLNAAQDAIDSYCRQVFEASADSTRYFDAVEDVDGPRLMLDYPLCAITSVTNGDSVAVAGTKYVKEPRNTTPWYALTLKANAGISWTYTSTPENAITIVGRWAHSTTAPSDIAHVCTRLAAYLYRQRTNASDLDRAIAIGNNAMLLPADLPRDIQKLLAPYRRLV